MEGAFPIASVKSEMQNKPPIYFDMPLTWTVDAVRAKQPSVRTTGQQEAASNYHGCLHCRQKKAAPYIIFSKKTIPKMEVLPHGAVIHCNEKGWMMVELLNE